MSSEGAGDAPPLNDSPRSHQIWEGRGRAVSPNGRWLCIEDRTDRKPNLALVDLVTGTTRLLTTTGSWTKGFPGSWGGRVPFSPDSSAVAVGWQTMDGSRWDVRLVRVHDGDVRVLVDHDPAFRWMLPLAWSPDETELAMLARRREQEGFELRVHSFATQSFCAGRDLGSEPLQSLCYSPDGRFLAYDVRRQVFVLPREVDDERPRRVCDGRLLQWTERGVLVSSDGIRSSEVAVVPLVDGEVSGVAEVLSNDRIGNVLGVTEAGDFFHSLQSRATDVFVADLDPTSWTVGPPERIASAQSDSSVSWSPDGVRLAFLAEDGPSESELPLVIRDTAGDTERVVLLDTLTRYHAFQPHWSPDGRFLLVQGASEHRGGIYRIDPGTGDVLPIVHTEDSAFLEWPVWCSDGRVIFTRWEPWTNVLVALDPATSREEVLYAAEPPNAIAHLSASPDGGHLAFVGWNRSTGRTALMMMPSAAGEPRELMELPTPAQSGYYMPYVQLTWTPDSQTILCAFSTNSALRFLAVPVRGGTARPFGPTIEGVLPYGLSLHPGGGRLAFVAGRRASQEVWVVPGLLENR